MKININGSRIPYEPDVILDYLSNLTRAIRPCCIYDLLNETINNLLWDRRWSRDDEMELSWINTDLSELVSVEVWL